MGNLGYVSNFDTLVDSAVYQMGIEPHRIPLVILSSIGIYLSFMILVKIFGSRVLTSMTASDAVIIIMFGAVAGRVILGHPPTLAAGVIGLATLMALEAAFGSLRRVIGWSRLIDRKPVLVLLDGEKVPSLTNRAHISHDDLTSAARKAGIGSLKDIKLMILEPTGQISIIRKGQPLDREVFRDVRGVDLINFDEQDNPNS